MKKEFNKKPALLTALVMSMMLTGCGGGDSTSESTSNDTVIDDTSNGIALVPQASPVRGALFYGNTNHQKLGSLVNVSIFDPANLAVLEGSSDIMAATTTRPMPSTTLTYNTADGTYSGLYVNSLYYMESGSPKRTPMVIEHNHDADPMYDYVNELAHSNATGLTSPAYTEINYLGTQRFLIAKNSLGDRVLVCPTAGADEVPIPFPANKTLWTVTFPAYGQAYDGAVVFDSTTDTFQKLTPPIAGCATCGVDPVQETYTDFTKSDGSALTLPAAANPIYFKVFDRGGTVNTVVVAEGKLYILDKSKLTIEEPSFASSGTAITLADLLTSTNKGAFKLSGDSLYFMYSDGNIYRVNLDTKVVTQLTDGMGSAETLPLRIHTFTDAQVIYGHDGLMLAVSKSASKASPLLLAENTETSGLRSPFTFGFGGHFLYVTYKLDTTTGNTTYNACVLDDSADVPSCKENSFWAGVSAAHSGKLNFNTEYPYTPYAYVRIDNTDNYGGGTIKAVVPTAPLDSGVALGSVPTYNFNTFLHASGYTTSTIDVDGYIVFYGKRDDNFVGDAFLLNLNKANSVVNLTKEAAPSADVISNSAAAAHCHGRYCAACHNFGGGKIYTDATGLTAAKGYNIKFKFKSGGEALARLGKGQGENFNILYSEINRTFTPVIVNATTGAEVKTTAPEHSGLAYSNCDYCHARPGTELQGMALSVINIAP